MSHTPFDYSVRLEKLMSFTEGRVVLILEGGSNLDFISKSMHAYLEVLLADKPIIESVPGTSFNSYQVDQQQRETLPFEKSYM